MLDDATMHLALAARLDQAERASSVAFWRAARAAGVGVHILDDGEIAVAAAPDMPGMVFNVALGFAQHPELVDRAIEHFASHGASGWLLADDPPWTDVVAEASYARWAAPVERVQPQKADAVGVRELARDEVGPWSSVVVAASAMPPAIGEAWLRLEPHLVAEPQHHRFVAEIDGRPVGAASLHTHDGVGWLRAGSVLPEARGRGVQRALIAARAELARRIGCDVIGASTIEDGASAANVTRLGLERVATRYSYPVPPRS